MHLADAASTGLEGARDSPFKTIARSPTGTLTWAIGLILWVWWRKQITRWCFPKTPPLNCVEGRPPHTPQVWMGKDWQNFKGIPALKPLGIYLCPNLWSLRHKGNTLQFRVYNFLVEGALELRMFSTTSAERSSLRNLSPSGTRTTASTSLAGCEILCPQHVWEGRSGLGSYMGGDLGVL